MSIDVDFVSLTLGSNVSLVSQWCASATGRQCSAEPIPEFYEFETRKIHGFTNIRHKILFYS